MKKLLLTIAGVFVGLSMLSAQISFSFNPQKGVTYQHTVDMTQDIKQNVMGQDIVIEQKIRTTYDMDVVEKTKEEIKITFTYKEMGYVLTNPMMSMKYDSKNADPNATGMDGMIAKIFNSFIGKQFEVVVLTDGSVKSVSGMEAIVEDMLKAVGSDMMAQQMAGGMKMQFSDEAMRSNFEHSFKIYPPKAIKPGESWNVEQNINTGDASMSMLVKSVYTLKSTDSKVAQVDVVSDISGAEGKIKGVQNGKLTIDLATGLTTDSQVKQEISGAISSNGVDIIMDLNSTIDVKTAVVK